MRTVDHKYKDQIYQKSENSVRQSYIKCCYLFLKRLQNWETKWFLWIVILFWLKIKECSVLFSFVWMLKIYWVNTTIKFWEYCVCIQKKKSPPAGISYLSWHFFFFPLHNDLKDWESNLLEVTMYVYIYTYLQWALWEWIAY